MTTTSTDKDQTFLTKDFSNICFSLNKSPLYLHFWHLAGIQKRQDVSLILKDTLIGHMVVVSHELVTLQRHSLSNSTFNWNQRPHMQKSAQPIYMRYL